MYRVHSYISDTKGEHNTIFYRYSGTGSRAPSVDSNYDTNGCVAACDHCLPISVYLFPPSLFKRKGKKTPDRKLALWVQVMVIYAVQILYFPSICHDTGIVTRKHVMRSFKL